MTAKVSISWVTASLAAAVMLALCYVVLFVVPKFEQIYRDLNIKLPITTMSMLFMANWGLWLVYLVLGVGVILTECYYSGRTAKICFNVGLLVMGLILGMLVVVGLFAPLISVVEVLGNKEPA